MTKVGLIGFLFVLLFFSPAVHGQKVKYKDIFGLLSTKQYETAEPFLKKYLKENDDNPNAFLFMGIIFQEKSSKMDILKSTELVDATMDSAIIFYDKAYKTIDDREVRKNDEYYQAYNRRDLRTGEFGVKLSDIQFDLEKKIQSLKERIDKVKMVKYYFALSDSSYKKANETFLNLRNEYPSQRQLYLRANEITLKDLKNLSNRFDSCVSAFDNYKAALSNLGRTGYNQTISLKPVTDLHKDGGTSADFYKDELSLWDYKKFSEEAIQIIEKDIVPMRAHLITYDIEINKLRERLNKDSVSVKNDLTKLIDELLYQQLQRYDPDPLPMEVFCMKTADLEYRSSVLEHKPLRDSANVHFRLSLISEEIKYLNKLDSIASKLAQSDIDQKAIDYGYFITNTYSNTIVLHSYIKALKEYAEREKRAKNEQLLQAQEALHWIIDGADSIPLTTGVLNKRFKPLVTLDENYTVGLAYKDSLTVDGYFYTITPSRVPAAKFTFPVDKPSFKQSRFTNTRALTYADPLGHVYYILLYNQVANKEKYQATLAKIYSSDGLAWSNNIALPFIPTELKFKPETSELTIIGDGTTQMLVDKNGKLLAGK
jgi:hypothetical protein